MFQGIDMTGPVSTLITFTGNGDEYTYSESFYIPSEYQENPVQPTNPDVYIEDRQMFQVWIDIA